ncbi:unnamed protein product, partial [Discosporangium mesarthrocarpum]
QFSHAAGAASPLHFSFQSCAQRPRLSCGDPPPSADLEGICTVTLLHHSRSGSSTHIDPTPCFFCAAVTVWCVLHSILLRFHEDPCVHTSWGYQNYPVVIMEP